MSEIFYYHLTRSRIQDSLPILLQKAYERDWRAIVQTRDAEQCAQLDARLWLWRDDSFLPHSCAANGDDPSEQPIWITDGEDNPNSAHIRFLIHGATCSDYDSYERLARLFDGHDDEAVAEARAHWRAEADMGHSLTYWQQDESGRFSAKKD